MQMKKVITIVGARPQFIKMAMVSLALKKERVKEVIVNTGQHYDLNMSQVFLKELAVPRIKYNLKVGSDSRTRQIIKMVNLINEVLLREKPNMVLVYGDTNSTLAGALAAQRNNIKVAHVEAGLRNFNNDMPEEINRTITDNIASIFFCPTKTAVKNLKKEGKRKGIYLVGDVMYDLLKRQDINTTKNGYFLCTIHRASNTDDVTNLKNIFNALGKLKQEIIFPLHPRTRKFLKKHKVRVANNIKMLKPVSYKKMIELEKNASVIITDSGGVQKEALILNVPCVTLRNETEWVETIKSNANCIAGADTKKISTLINKMARQKLKINPEKFYGNGFAHRKIAEIIKKELKG